MKPPFRVAGIFVLAITVAVAIGSTIAVAGSDRRESRNERPQNEPLLRISHLLRESRGNPAALIAGTISDRRASAKRRRGTGISSERSRQPRTRVYAAALDWPYAYSLVTKRGIFSFDESEDFPRGEGFALVRRNVLTGEQSILMKLRRALPYALRAGAGRVAISLVDTAESRNGTRVTSRVIEFDSSTTTPYVLAHNIVQWADDDEFGSRICGRISVLTGVADTGEAIVTELTGTCTTDGRSSYTLETVALATGGSRRVLDGHGALGQLFFGRSTLYNGQLLRSSPMSANVSRVDTNTGAESRLWHDNRSWFFFNAAYSVSQARDGTVAVSAGPLTNAESEDDDDSRDAPQPLVIFPHGSADQPNAIEPVNRTSVATQYCGDTLYELQTTRRSVESTELGFILSLFNGGMHASTRLKVIARDRDGGSPRRLAITRKSWVRAFGCDGETLLLATAPRSKLHVTRYGP